MILKGFYFLPFLRSSQCSVLENWHWYSQTAMYDILLFEIFDGAQPLREIGFRY